MVTETNSYSFPPPHHAHSPALWRHQLLLVVVLLCGLQLASTPTSLAADDGAGKVADSKLKDNRSYAKSSSYRSGHFNGVGDSLQYSNRVPDYFRDYRDIYQSDGTYRQPVGIQVLNEKVAVVPTRLTGQLFEIGLEDFSVREAFADQQRRWSSICRLHDEYVAVADATQGSVVVFKVREGGWKAVAELSTPGLPKAMLWNAATRELMITTVWSKRLYRFRADSDAYDKWQTANVVDLPIHGGKMLHLDKASMLLVTDAFSRDYVILKTAADDLTIVKQGAVFGHNISQIATSQNEEYVIFIQQLLNEFITSLRGDITWGGMLSNNIRWLKTEQLLELQDDDIFSQSRFLPLGQVGNGAGDPTSFSIIDDGRFAVTLGGIDRVAIIDTTNNKQIQLSVGMHPVDCTLTPKGTHLLVVNEFSDDISAIELASNQVLRVPLGPLREPNATERGERLFFHSRLSHDGWMSCHSCHSFGHTNGLANDNLSDQSTGSPKRIPSLLGQAETAPYGWTGQFVELEKQVLNSVVSTMASDDGITEGYVSDISDFVRSLKSPPSVSTARGLSEVDEPSFRRGRDLFRQVGCAECHAGNFHTSSGTFDVGLIDEEGVSHFNPPSLNGVSQRASHLFHDSSASSLSELLKVRRHQVPEDLSEREIDDILMYLERL